MVDNITYKALSSENIEEYIAYLKIAMSEEPDMMTAEAVDEFGINQRINDPFFQKTHSILAVENGNVVGRIEYHFYGCLQNGYKMAYVDWAYVLRSHRHKGIARGLFAEFEKKCLQNDIDQFYLIRAENEYADRFYKHFENVELSNEPMLRKYLKQS